LLLLLCCVQVNDDWILRRLEKWGRRENMPFLGPQKAAILQQLLVQQQPRLAVEVGSMAGYSAIVIAQVGACGSCSGLQMPVEGALLCSSLACLFVAALVLI
jgi:hypothetical protein